MQKASQERRQKTCIFCQTTLTLASWSTLDTQSSWLKRHVCFGRWLALGVPLVLNKRFLIRARVRALETIALERQAKPGTVRQIDPPILRFKATASRESGREAHGQQKSVRAEQSTHESCEQARQGKQSGRWASLAEVRCTSTRSCHGKASATCVWSLPVCDTYLWQRLVGEQAAKVRNDLVTLGGQVDELGHGAVAERVLKVIRVRG